MLFDLFLQSSYNVHKDTLKHFFSLILRSCWVGQKLMHALWVWLIAFFILSDTQPRMVCSQGGCNVQKVITWTQFSVSHHAELDKKQNKRAGTVISLTTWPYLWVLHQPSPQLNVNQHTSHKSHRHSPPHQHTPRGSKNRCQRGGFGEIGLFLSPVAQIWLGHRLRGASRSRRQSAGRRADTAGNFCSGWCTSARFVFQSVTFRFVLFSQLSNRTNFENFTGRF